MESGEVVDQAEADLLKRPTTGEYGEQLPYSVEKILALSGGFGRFQIRLMCICVLSFFSCGINMVGLPSILLLRVDEAFNLTSKLEADMVSSTFFTGYTVGLPVWALVADYKGRRPATIAALTCMSVFGACMYITNQYWLFLLFRGLCGFATCGAFTSALVLTLEYCDSSMRPICKASYAIFWSSSLLFCAGVGYALREKAFGFLAVIQIPSVAALVLLSMLLPESPRFYLVHGRLRESMEALLEVADYNRVALPFDRETALAYPDLFLGESHQTTDHHESVVTNVADVEHVADSMQRRVSSDQIKSMDNVEQSLSPRLSVLTDTSMSHRSLTQLQARTNSDHHQNHHIKSALHATTVESNMWTSFATLWSPQVRYNTVMISFVQFIGTGSYYSVAFASKLASVPNLYLASALGFFIELPTHISMMILANRIGRKATLISYFVGVLVPCIVLSIPAAADTQAARGLGMIARMSSLGTSTLTYVFAAESFPSVCRNAGVSVAALVGHAAPIITPLIMDGTKYGLVIIGSLCFLAIAALTTLAETGGHELVDIVDDDIHTHDMGIPAQK